MAALLFYVNERVGSPLYAADLTPLVLLPLELA
jgi:hypothetical protein